ncbi:MAG: FAD-dependent thymidylate synthase [Dehalococcoidia bacterium]|jgi:thymidylate synthase (FAD)|nr:FAD-dependent thymidylate synthase [Dehalococcoidia bacterium]
MAEKYDVQVTLLAITPEAERLIESAGRLCWATQDKTGTVPDRIQRWLEIGHESMVEHASASFLIRGSRAMTHELVRHRLASYSQRSQRYVRETEPSYLVPPEVRASAAAVEAYTSAMESAWKAYAALLKSGLKPEIARYVLPNSCYTDIVCTWNFRELRHIIRLRTSPRALPEIRDVAEALRAIMKREAPQVFEDL